MISRGARAERQANLRLLESGRIETDEKRKKLELQHAAIPPLSPAQAEGGFARILAMSANEFVEFFQDYRLRMAGKNAFWYACGDPRETPHKDDPEMAAAVETVNLALHEYDEARLKLRIAELFGGRVPPGNSGANPAGSVRSNTALIRLDLLELSISGAKAVSFYESLYSGDLRAVDSENSKYVWETTVRAHATRKAEEQSTNGDGARGAPTDALL